MALCLSYKKLFWESYCTSNAEWEKTQQASLTVRYTNLWEAWSSRVGGVGGRKADRRVHSALSLLLVDSVSLTLRQIEEVLHCFQIHQQGLWGCARVLLLPQDLWQQTLSNTNTHISALNFTRRINYSFTSTNGKRLIRRWIELSWCVFSCFLKWGMIGHLLLHDIGNILATVFIFYHGC